MSVKVVEPMPIYLKKVPNKKKVINVPMVGEKPAGDDTLEIPLSKYDLKAHLSIARNALSSENGLASLSPAELGCLNLLLGLVTSMEGFPKLCTAYDLFDNKGGRNKEYHLKGGAFILMGLLLGGFPIKQALSSQLCSLLGFKTSEGEDSQTQVYRMKKEFTEHALSNENYPFQLKQQQLANAFFESIQFFLSLEQHIDNNHTKKLHKEISFKFNNITLSELNHISANYLNDQKTLDVLVVK